MTKTKAAPLAASIIFGAARVALGVFWLLEGAAKYSAKFGGADIGFVVSGAANGQRIPDFFVWFAANVLGAAPDTFGVIVPLLETGLGVALILGVFTKLAAIGSALNLAFYWSSDQLIDQYPIMLALSVAVLAAPVAAARFSVTTLVTNLLARKGRQSALLDGPLRAWL